MIAVLSDYYCRSLQLAEATPVAEEKDIKFQMVISPELCRLIDGARKLSKTSRRAWLLQAAQEKLEREGKLLQNK